MSNKHTSTKQFATLVEFLKENSGIAKGILNAPKYKAKTRELWDEITVVLNSLGPPVKTSDGWKKVWKDFKYHIKDKLRENKKSMLGTGGGPNKQHVFSVLEEDIIALLVCGLKVRKFGTADALPTREPLKEKIEQIRQNLSPETCQLFEESEILLSGEINEQPEEGEFDKEMEEHAQKTPTRHTRTSAATSKKLLELQVNQQKIYQEKSLNLLEEQNKLLERKNKELKLQTEEMKKIRRLKEQKLKILKRKNEIMENESKENTKLKLRELERV
ncbi:uncharacterized protein LOC129945048 [Eupeodes corollae]|uniref:uncharacterized protein LOC129945048 n=1 Tax=Eupeodes corollae TaxID=290404 RepID=UPI002490C6CC|nr:uncharacterized protein LOC129945048 [Eupeodes corollae]